MNISREEKITEAIYRMALLNIFPQTIKDFEEKNLVSISEPPFGAYFWADEEEIKQIQKIEAKYNTLVYIAIRSYTEFGILLSYFCVSNNKKEWTIDRRYLANNETVAYIRNSNCDTDSEFGYIGFKLAPAAGLIRVWQQESLFTFCFSRR